MNNLQRRGGHLSKSLIINEIKLLTKNKNMIIYKKKGGKHDGHIR